MNTYEKHKILIVGDCPGLKHTSYYDSPAGKILLDIMHKATIPDSRFSYLSMFPDKPFGGSGLTNFHTVETAKTINSASLKELYPTEAFLEHYEKLKQLFNSEIPDKFSLIIGLGDYPLWLLTEDYSTVKRKGSWMVPTGIGKYRGSMLYTSKEFKKLPFLPVYDIESTYKIFPWRAMLQHDISTRVGKLPNYHKETVEKVWKEPNRQYKIQPSFEDIVEILQDLIKDANIEQELGSSKLEIAVDIETRSDFIACIGFAWSKVRAICIPLLTTQKDKKVGYWTLEEELEITLLLRELFQHPHVSIIGQNFSFDMQYIVSQMFFTFKIGEDTMVKHHTLYPGGGNPLTTNQSGGTQGLVQKSLNNLSSLYCTHHRYWKDEGKLWETNMPEDRLWSYNCRDCCVTYEVSINQDKILENARKRKQYAFQMRQLNDLAIPMMLKGVRINQEARNKMVFELLEAMTQFENLLKPLVPETILPLPKKGAAPWYKSPTQLAFLFYEVLGIKPVYSQTGRPTTGKQALPIIAKREPIVAPLVKVLEQYRSLNVFYGTFLTAALDKDGRIRCSYNVTGTDTYRWSSSKNIFGGGGNLQNIPKGTKE